MTTKPKPRARRKKVEPEFYPVRLQLSRRKEARLVTHENFACINFMRKVEEK